MDLSRRYSGLVLWLVGVIILAVLMLVKFLSERVHFRHDPKRGARHGATSRLVLRVPS